MKQKIAREPGPSEAIQLVGYMQHKWDSSQE